MDQRQGGGDWQLLGAYLMNSSVNHRVVLSDQADDPALHDLVIDNSHPGTTQTGVWSARTWTGGGWFWGANYEGMDVADIGAKFTWPADIPARGQYRVYARWSATYGTTEYANAADHKVIHTGGNTTVTVNQRESGGQWVPLGVFELEPSSDPLVEFPVAMK